LSDENTKISTSIRCRYNDPPNKTVLNGYVLLAKHKLSKFQIWKAKKKKEQDLPIGIGDIEIDHEVYLQSPS
jgi:hypothetical protein